jgi:hypothetical protein
MSNGKGKLNKDTRTQPNNRVCGKKRLELILLGLDAGKSQRKIAAELGVDEGTVRRDIKILLLSESCLTAIQNGASAEKYLRAERHQAGEKAVRLRLAQEKTAAENSKAQRLAEENLNACHSNALARLLLCWLDRKLPGAAYKEQLLEIVERSNRGIGDKLATPRPNPSETLALCAQGDEPGYLPDKIGFFASVLGLALPLMAPEWAIRCRSIDKAMRAIQNPRHCPAELHT